MRIVIDVRDELIQEWGAMYIHNIQYDAQKVLMLVPGFKYTKDLPEGEKPALVLHVLPSPANNAQKKVDTPPAPDEREKAPEPLESQSTAPVEGEVASDQAVPTATDEPVAENTEPVVADDAPVPEDTAPVVEDTTPPIPPEAKEDASTTE